ncbi:MAG: ATP-binding protein [Naasia sp.]
MSVDALESEAPGLKKPANPITSSQVEVVISTSISVIGLLFGAQAVPPLLSQMDEMMTPLGLTVIVAVFGSLLLAGLAAIFRQWTRPVFGLVAGVYLVTLAVWPLIVPPLAVDDVPWIFYLSNVASACAVNAARWPIALGYVIVTPITLALMRMTPSGGAVDLLGATLDGVYSFLIGMVLLVIILSLRQAAREVDRAQSFALESYATAVRHHATENERVRVDALVHDNVLVTLLSAARARTPETKALAARMARSAISHLGDAQTTFPVMAGDVRIDELVGRLRVAVADQPRAFDVHIRIPETADLPSPAADALTEAATQAMVNSVNHADRGAVGPVTRTVRVSTPGRGAVEIVVADTGAGFDIAAVPLERLGVRTSIIDRMEKVGGQATVDSRPGVGTTITLRWPLPTALDAPADLDDGSPTAEPFGGAWS